MKSENMKIFDIGMNCGHFTDRAFSLFGNDVNIVGLEPKPENYDKLKEKYKNKENVTILELALSDKNEEKTFYLSTENWGSTLNNEWVNTSRFVDCFDNRTIKVTTITLDSLICAYGIPDIAKIDIEGHEYEGILGLTQKINKLCFEFAEEDLNVKKTCDYLHGLGYNNFGFIEGDDYLREPYSYTTYENFKLFERFNVNKKQFWGMIWVK